MDDEITHRRQEIVLRLRRELRTALQQCAAGVAHEDVLTGGDSFPGVFFPDASLVAWDWVPLSDAGEIVAITEADLDLETNTAFSGRHTF